MNSQSRRYRWPVIAAVIMVTFNLTVITTVAAVNITAVTRNLAPGSTGEEVVILQQFLIEQNKGPLAQSLAAVGATGYFGELTRQALSEFQSSVGITPASGYFGPKTKNYLLSGRPPVLPPRCEGLCPPGQQLVTASCQGQPPSCTYRCDPLPNPVPVPIPPPGPGPVPGPQPPPSPGENSCNSQGSCRYGENCPSGTECSGLPAYSCLPRGCPAPKCLAINTLIAAPAGEIPVQAAQTGMMVWTLDRYQRRTAAPLLKAAKTPVSSLHRMVRLTLADGRTLSVSPGHPTTDGRTIEQISAGEFLAGSVVTKTELVAYGGSAVYDILPAGDSGVYWANGIPLKSTLTP